MEHLRCGRCRAYIRLRQNKNVKVTNERNRKRGTDVGGIGDASHDCGEHCAAENRHDLERRAALGERAKILDAERKNCREHDGVKKANQHECPDRCRSTVRGP
jgi:hypothetical protein